jgi:hypothetical protein
MRLIENASGFRRLLVLAGLLALTWLAVVLVGSLSAAALSAISEWMRVQDPSTQVSGPSRGIGRLLQEALEGAAVLTVAPFLPSLWQATDRGIVLGFWLIFMGTLVAGTLLCLPLIGLRDRKRLPLRWSIVSGGVLGGMLGVGVVLTMLDGVRLLRLPNPVESLHAPLGGSVTAMMAVLLASWMITGGIWAWALARVGRSGHPDVIARFVRRLFAGTCVELAIAAPTYALGIRRDSCWCEWGSWFGIVGGIAILTVLCGPMLVLLWTREARLQWMRASCRGCGYPLRTGSALCPECGAPVPAGAGA